MNFLLTILLLTSFFQGPDFTYNVSIVGKLKTADHNPVSDSYKILVFEGESFLADDHTRPSGKFQLDFLTGERTKSTFDFFSVFNSDTLLIASLDGFMSDGEISCNFFLPKLLPSKTIQCKRCHRSDKMYQLIYFPTQQKYFDRSVYKFYCSYDKTKSQ